MAPGVPACFRISGLEDLKGLGTRVQGFRGLGCREEGLGFWELGFREEGLGFRV